MAFLRKRDITLFAVAGLVALVGARGEQNRSAQLNRQERTILQLCNNVSIVDGLVQASISAVQKQLVDDVRDHRAAAAQGDLDFIREFTVYHLNLIDQLTSGDSTCVNS